MTIDVRTAALLICGLLGGCGANFNSIYRTIDTEASGRQPSVLIDVKQRAILSVQRTDRPDDGLSASGIGSGNPAEPRPAAGDAKASTTNVMCAEPSPDALSALSQSFASEGAFNFKSDETRQIEAQARMVVARAESAAFVGLRTSTIQLLRDSMYRLCEAFAAGALSRKDFTLLQRRYQSSMLALLAIEQLTGTISTRPVAIAGNAMAATADGLQVIQEKLAEAKKAEVDANASLESAKQAHTQADTKVKEAQAAVDKCADCAEKATLEAALVKAKEDRDGAKTKLTKAEGEAKRAADYSESLAAVAARASSVLKAQASGSIVGGDGDLTDTNRTVMTSKAAAEVAARVKEIVFGVFTGSYAFEICSQAFESLRTAPDKGKLDMYQSQVLAFCEDAFMVLATGTTPKATVEDTAAASGIREPVPTADATKPPKAVLPVLPADRGVQIFNNANRLANQPATENAPKR